LLEEKIIAMLTAAIQKGEYSGCQFRFRPQFQKVLDDLAQHFRSKPAADLREADWNAALKLSWGVTPADLGTQSVLIRRLLGLPQRLPERIPESVIPLSMISEHGNIEAAKDQIQRLFSRVGAGATSLDEIFSELRSRLASRTPRKGTVRSVLDSLPYLEKETSGKYRVRLERLTNYVDQYERILSDRGEAMHIKVLDAELSRLLASGHVVASRRTVSRRLTSSTRFVPVGRSGFWGLSRWANLETGTIADVSAALLARAGAPLTEDALACLMRPIRALSEKSIGSLLRLDRRFRKIGPRTWDLLQQATSPEAKAAKLRAR